MHNFILSGPFLYKKTGAVLSAPVELKTGLKVYRIMHYSLFIIHSKTKKKSYFFFVFAVTPRIVADGTDACFMKALGLMPTMCLNCLEKW